MHQFQVITRLRTLAAATITMEVVAEAEVYRHSTIHWAQLAAAVQHCPRKAAAVIFPSFSRQVP